jgi:hypothetical protein
MRRLFVIVALVVLGCGNAEAPEAPTPDPDATPCALITTGLGLRWEKLNHRVSWMRLAPVEDGCDVGAVLDAAFIGGDFSTGEVMTDTPVLYYAGTELAAPGIIGVFTGSESLSITAPIEDAHTSVSLDFSEAHLSGFDEYVVLIDGFDLRTDVPQFEQYPDNGYDPAHGYTTRGHGVEVSEPDVGDEGLSFVIRFRAAWGPSDRDDMNAALAHATVLGEVHYKVLGITGGAVTTVENAYRLEYEPPVPLEEQTIAPAATEDIQVTAAVESDLPVLIPGWRSFDLRLDPDGDADPDGGGPIGYYLRGWSVEARVVEHAGETATLAISGYASNASGFIAYYPLIVDFQAEVALIQLPAPASASPVELMESFETGAERFSIR